MDEGLDREVNKDLTRLTPAVKFLKPYVKQVIVASIALIITAGATLSIGQGVRLVIDSGFASGQADVLVDSITLFASMDVFRLLLTIFKPIF